MIEMEQFDRLYDFLLLLCIKSWRKRLLYFHPKQITANFAETFNVFRRT